MLVIWMTPDLISCDIIEEAEHEVEAVEEEEKVAWLKDYLPTETDYSCTLLENSKIKCQLVEAQEQDHHNNHCYLLLRNKWLCHHVILILLRFLDARKQFLCSNLPLYWKGSLTCLNEFVWEVLWIGDHLCDCLPHVSVVEEKREEDDVDPVDGVFEVSKPISSQLYQFLQYEKQTTNFAQNH